MDGADLILTTPVMMPSPLETTAGGGLAGVSGGTQMFDARPAGAEKTEQLAKDFESVLLTQLVDKMKDTVGQSELGEDAAADQVQGLFWLYLARDIADKGGFGLWKDLYRFFNDLQNSDVSAKANSETVREYLGRRAVAGDAPAQSLDEGL